MTNYNERLDEVLNWHSKCREEIKVASVSFADEKWAEEQYRKIVHKHKALAKQAITSLIKELVAEAKPEVKAHPLGPVTLAICQRGLDYYEANLLKALEEV